MKQLAISFLAVSIILFFACKKEEYIDNKPKLGITVVDTNSNLLENAFVKLYKIESNWFGS